MNILELIAERKILAAIENGEFSDLPGFGQPLQWEEDAHIPRDLFLAQHLLKKNGYTLPWIEESRQIADQIAALRRDLGATAEAGGASPQPGRGWVERVQRLNKRILEYNCTVPLERFHILPLQLDREIERARPASSPPPHHREPHVPSAV